MIEDVLKSLTCKQLVEYRMNDDRSITYTDVNGDMSETRYVPERTCNEFECENVGSMCSWCVRNYCFDNFKPKVVE